jgi:phosphonate transport system permease protein
MSTAGTTQRLPLFDRIFRPEHIVLEIGHSIDRPRSRMPLILFCLAAVILVSMRATGFSFSILIQRGNQLTVILGKIFHPDWSYFPKVISPLIETIKMSVIGTVAGCAIGLPLAIFASSNINRNKPSLLVIRFILAVMRSVPTLIYASVLALIFSLGAFAGSVAIVIFTVGIVAKMLYESIETIDMGPFEAMTSFGSSTFQAFWAACMPQILPTYLDDCLYCFELNVRASSILGYVGAGGLGVLIRERTGLRAYDDLGCVLITLFVVVWIIDLLSDYIRSKLT